MSVLRTLAGAALRKRTMPRAKRRAEITSGRTMPGSKLQARMSSPGFCGPAILISCAELLAASRNRNMNPTGNWTRAASLAIRKSDRARVQHHRSDPLRDDKQKKQGRAHYAHDGHETPGATNW